MSVYDNVDLGLRTQGKKLMKEEKDEQINQALRDADLCEEFGSNLQT
jgi:ABC-type phosphate transport system ATPase subunit